jgi:hypothetical protein
MIEMNVFNKIKVQIVLLTIAALTVIFVAIPIIFSFFWNIVMPLFGFPKLGYVEALALIIVLGIVGSFFKKK